MNHLTHNLTRKIFGIVLLFSQTPHRAMKLLNLNPI